VPAGEVWRYGLIYPFQVAPRLAAALCNIRKVHNPGVDFELGTDLILFDSLAGVRPDRAITICRNHEAPNPNSDPPNLRSVVVKYPVAGAFVPPGARLADGSLLPHAGTGFGLGTAQAWPLDDRDLGHSPDRVGRRAYPGQESYEYLELFQFAYDGRTFHASQPEHVPKTREVDGWMLDSNPIRNGIPDGDDLLLAYCCRRAGTDRTSRDGAASGVLRWRRTGGTWAPHAFVPVTPADNSGEPTLIRDLDGSLLFCARGAGDPERCAIRVWRSADSGRTWELRIEALGPISMSPVSINQAADGTPYVGANLYEVPLFPIGDGRYNHSAYRAAERGPGRQRLGGWMRERLVLWPLTTDRSRLGVPVMARDCRAEFGSPPGGSTWTADHPSAMTLQLADGRWHSILGYRICERAEITHGIAATPQSGAYLEEVVSIGEPVPAWRF
jgi:hypothetical protein